MNRPTTWTFLLVDPRNHQTFCVGQSRQPPDELLEYLYARPRLLPRIADRILFELSMKYMEPTVYGLPSNDVGKARRALARSQRRGSIDPIACCSALLARSHPSLWSKAAPTSPETAFAVHRMRWEEDLTPTQIMQKTGLKKSALMHMLSGRRHRKVFEEFHVARNRLAEARERSRKSPGGDFPDYSSIPSGGEELGVHR